MTNNVEGCIKSYMILRGVGWGGGEGKMPQNGMTLAGCTKTSDILEQFSLV